MIVLDASAAVDLLAGNERVVSRLRTRVLHSGDAAFAPHLLDVEVASAVRRLARRGEIPRERAEIALAYLPRLRVVRVPHVRLLERAWELRNNVTIQDAMYVTLAEALGAPLVTTDAALAGSSGHRAFVELVSP